VKRIDHAYLNRTFKEPDLSELTIFGVDEVAHCKGHHYFTLVFDLVKGKLVWIGKGRSKETLDQFFKKLGKEGF
jgi:transposase